MVVVGKPKLTDYPVVQEIAQKLGATPAQVLIAWGVYRGYIVIPKSVQEERIISNFKQIELSKEDYEAVSAVGKDNYTRFENASMFSVRWYSYGYSGSTSHTRTSPSGISISLMSPSKSKRRIKSRLIRGPTN